jgi:methionyl-tRNA synthetase
VSGCLSRLFEAGQIYLADYQGLYSVGQERFVTDKELVDGKLPEDKEPPVLRREPNYFFRMEAHREWMRQFLLDTPELIQPPQLTYPYGKEACEDWRSGNDARRRGLHPA